MVPSPSADGSIVSNAPPWPVPLSHSCCQSSDKENSQQLLWKKNKRKHSTKITETVMLSRLIYKKSFWCEMSPWWEALKWQQWSLRHRDYVVWEHISNWWVKGILIIFRPSDSFSVQNLTSIYFFPLPCDRSSTAQGLPPLSFLLPQIVATNILSLLKRKNRFLTLGIFILYILPIIVHYQATLSIVILI